MTGIHVVAAKDMQIGTNKNKIMFMLRSLKTHWKNDKPQLIKISALKIEGNRNSQSKCNKLPCPFTALKKYFKIRGGYRTEQENFFVFSDGSPVKSLNVRKCLRNALVQMGYDHRLYHFHGIRGGRAQDLLKLGVSIETIKKLGRWRPNAVFRYLR